MRDTMATHAAAIALALALIGIGSTTRAQPRESPPTDAAPSDAAPSDAPPSDAPPSDAPPSEEPPRDAPPSDATPSDAPPSDATPSDASPSDAPNDPPTGGAPPRDAPPDAATRDAQHTEDGASDEPDGDPAAVWRWPGTFVWDVGLRLAIPAQTGFDRALVSHGYGDVRVVPGIVSGLAFPAGVEWLWLGGQLGVRGRTWSHGEREDASLMAVDLLAMVRVRFLLGDRVELGAAVGGGVGWLGVWVNGVMSDRIVGRFNIQGELAFLIGRDVAIGPRVGWDYFQGEGMNVYRHSVEAGGPYVGLSVEARE